LIYLGAPLNYQANLPNTASFNTSAFNIVSSQQLSNNYRTFPTYFNNLRIDSMNNFNTNLTKSFVVHENLRAGGSFQLDQPGGVRIAEPVGDRIDLRLHHDGYQFAARDSACATRDLLIGRPRRRFANVLPDRSLARAAPKGP
jgi:hypothetical protein